MNRIKGNEECNLHNTDIREICLHKKIIQNYSNFITKLITKDY